MNDNDDFEDESDKTMLRPRPGGRRPGAGAPAPPPMAPPMGTPQAPMQPQPMAPVQAPPSGPARAALPSLDSIRSAGSSPLSSAAAPLLILMSQLRGLPSHSDVNGLHQQVMGRIQKFESDAMAAGVSTEHVTSARYCLCAALDEMVLSTPWGSESIWSTRTLLTTFHKETWGGEKFFQILDRLKADAARNVDLLDLMYLCLAMGFEGKFKIQERGQTQLAVVREELYRLIRQCRGDFERTLSPHWKGVEDKRNPLARFVPLWVVASVLLAVLVGLFISFRFALAKTGQPIDRVLSNVGMQDIGRPSAAMMPMALQLRPLLAGLEAQGLINITVQGGVTIVTLQGDGLFASGSAEVNEQYRTVLQQIGVAIDQVPGPVRVIGHTDNVPIRSFRFQSNWELSRERAIDVAEALAEPMAAKSRLIPQGVADTLPVSTNDTAQGRAMNRRVEVIHSAQAQSQ